MPDWLLQVIVSGAVTGAVTWGVVRTELKYLRRDVDHLTQRLNDHEQSTHERRQCAMRGLPVVLD